MIIAAARYNDANIWRIQTDNPTEEILRKSVDGPYLESCGPSAMTTCIGALGHPTAFIGPGTYQPQPEEIAMDYFHDPANGAKLTAVRKSTPASEWMGNRVPQFYPLAAREVFGVMAEFKWGANFDTIIQDIREGCTIQICLKEPGHYEAVVGYDVEKDELIYHDSWPRKSHKNGGFMERYTRSDAQNFKPFRITYHL